MKKVQYNGSNILLVGCVEYSLKLKLAMFLSVYWVWCFSFFIFSAISIANDSGIGAVFSGVTNLVYLFLCATWIDDLFNEDY